MKKVLLGLVAAVFMVSFISTGISFAGGKCDILGKIKSVDKAKNEFTIIPSGTTEEKVVKVSKEYMDKKGGSTIKEGKVVEVYLDEKDPAMATKVKSSLTVPVGC